jgi:hypothetical protein
VDVIVQVIDDDLDDIEDLRAGVDEANAVSLVSSQLALKLAGGGF